MLIIIGLQLVSDTARRFTNNEHLKIVTSRTVDMDSQL